MQQTPSPLAAPASGGVPTPDDLAALLIRTAREEQGGAALLHRAVEGVVAPVSRASSAGADPGRGECVAEGRHPATAALTARAWPTDELKRAQEEPAGCTRVRAAARARMRDLFDLSPTAYLSTDALGVISEADGAAGALLGVPTHVLIGKPLKLYEAGNRSDLAQCLVRVQKEGRCEDAELHLQRRHGETVVVSCTAVRAGGEGEESMLRWELRDDSRNEEVERELVQLYGTVSEWPEGELCVAEESFRIPDMPEEYASIMIDAEGRVAGWSGGAERICGYTEEEALGRDGALLYPPEQALAVNPQRVLAEAARQGVAWEEGERVRKDGERFHAEVVVTALRDAAGGLAGFATIMRDRTVWKRAQQWRRDGEADVQHEQRLDAIARVTGSIVRHFNNVLTVVRGQAELAMNELDPGHPAWLDLREIATAADRGSTLHQQLLAFSREAPLRSTKMDPGAVIRDMRRMLERVLGENVWLDMRLEADPCQVQMDRTQFEQVLMNLAANARDAMAAGGTFSLRTQRVEMSPETGRRLPGMQRGPHLLLTVSDTGSGMDAETRARCFEPFFTTKSHRLGSGLGLSTVYGVLRQNGGHVRLESQAGRGTVFRIHLPLVRDAAPVAELLAPRRRTVLLVEDEDGVRRVIRRVLQRDGYAVLEAADALTAVRLAREHAASIDAVVADRVVPGADPAALVTALQEELPGVGIVQISGYSDAEVDRAANAPRPGILLSKPFAPADLTAAMVALLGPIPHAAS